MNRRERITAVFKGEEPDRTPMGFWMHFPTEQHHGEEALAAHLKYFEETKTDICKVMNEETIRLSVLRWNWLKGS